MAPPALGSRPHGEAAAVLELAGWGGEWRLLQEGPCGAGEPGQVGAEHPHRRASPPPSAQQPQREKPPWPRGRRRPPAPSADRACTAPRDLYSACPPRAPPLPRHVWTWSLNSPGKGRAKLPAEEEVPGGWRGPGRRQQRGRDRSPCRTPGPGHRLAPAAASPWGRGRCQLRGPRLSTAGGAEPTYWLQGPGCLTASREEGGVGSTELPQAETRSRVSGQAVPTLAVA